MTLAGCQLDIVWEDKPANYRRVEELVADAALPRGTLLALPEMFATGFTMRARDVAETPDGPTAQFLADLARKHGLYVLGGVVLAGEPRPRNELLVFDPEGRPAARYAKLHPFSLGAENQHYAAGERTMTFDWRGTTVGPAICYDLRFPEMFRRHARAGAQVIVVIANWPVARESHWMALLRARAIENQAYVLGVNRCGADPTLRYSGRTQIVDFTGEVIADAQGDERIIQAAVDLEHLKTYRSKLPFLADMRGDLVP